MIICAMDLGSVNVPPPLEHRQSGVGWSDQCTLEVNCSSGMHWSCIIAPESKFSYCFRTGKAQAASFKLDNRSRIV